VHASRRTPSHPLTHPHTHTPTPTHTHTGTNIHSRRPPPGPPPSPAQSRPPPAHSPQARPPSGPACIAQHSAAQRSMHSVDPPGRARLRAGVGAGRRQKGVQGCDPAAPAAGSWFRPCIQSRCTRPCCCSLEPRRQATLGRNRRQKRRVAPALHPRLTARPPWSLWHGCGPPAAPGQRAPPGGRRGARNGVVWCVIVGEGWCVGVGVWLCVVCGGWWGGGTRALGLLVGRGG
jgi:hypothetical protein